MQPHTATPSPQERTLRRDRLLCDQWHGAFALYDLPSSVRLSRIRPANLLFHRRTGTAKRLRSVPNRLISLGVLRLSVIQETESKSSREAAASISHAADKFVAWRTA